MNVDVFHNNTYMGTFPMEKFFNKNKTLGVGSIITVNELNYCIDDVYIRKEGTVVVSCYDR